jgi:hypothetical protein
MVLGLSNVLLARADSVAFADAQNTASLRVLNNVAGWPWAVQLAVCVAMVLGSAHNLKVVNAIVGLVAVHVIHVLACGIAKERSGDQTMDAVHRFLELDAQQDLQVSGVRVQLQLANAIYAPITLLAPNVPKAAGFVGFKPRNLFPKLDSSIHVYGLPVEQA